MKYYKATQKDDKDDVLYLCVSGTLRAPYEGPGRLRLEDVGYILTECSKEEYETMTQNENDYIINVGQEKGNLEPFDSAHTEIEGIEKAKKYLEDWKCVEVVYMPEDNIDINEIVWKRYNK